MNTGQKILLFFFCSLVLQFFYFPSPAHALRLELDYPRLPTVNQTPNDCLNLAQEHRFACFITYIYSFVIFAVGLICFFAFILAGFLFLFSGESVDKNKTAREIMLGAFIGTILLLISYLILNILNPQLINLSAQRPIAKCGIDFSCPDSMVCQDGICVATEPYPKMENDIYSYVEVPLGWLIERVKARAEIVEIQANNINDLIVEENIPGIASVQELAKCLKKLSQECDCAEIEAECLLKEKACLGECPDDPCDKRIDTLFCLEFDVIKLDSNLRIAMKDIAGEIKEKEEKLQEEKQNLKTAIADLKQEEQKLELAEFLMTNSQYRAEAQYETVEFAKKIETLDVFQDPAPSPLFDIPQKQVNDPASFFILKQGNQDIIDIVKSVVFENYNNPLPPDWTPPQQPNDPTDPKAVLLNTPELLQADPLWATEQINNCLVDRMATHGCGPTSTAIILQYFGADPSSFNPGDIAANLRNQIEYFCSQGSSNLGLALWAKSHYNVFFQDLGSLQDLGLEKLQEIIRSGKPVMAACRHFGRGPGSEIDWGHITVIRGVERAEADGKEHLFVFLQDSNFGRIAYEASLVKNYWRCYSLVSFAQ